MENITEIFLATDFMSHSDNAMKKATKMSKSLNVPLSILHVFNEDDIAPGPYYSILNEKPEWAEKVLEDHKKQGRKLLDDLFAKIGTGQKYFLEGNIKEAIVEFVNNNKVPLLVIGAKKNKPHCICSVSKYVVENVSSPVLLVPGS